MILIKKLDPRATIPTYGSEEAAGMDLYSVESVDLGPGERKVISTAIAMDIPTGWYGQVCPRSGWAVKHGIDTLAGVIDSDYRGEVNVVLINHGQFPIAITAGDRIAQLVVKPHHPHEIAEVDELGAQNVEEMVLVVQENNKNPEWDGTRAGVKDDQGKAQPFKGFINYFPRAILAISEVSVFGSKKYAWNGFSEVENGNDRYQEAQWRHLLAQCIEGQESLDDESELLHMMHEAWCGMAKVEMYLKDREKNEKNSDL